MPAKKLFLKKEVLTELSGDELTGVVGGSHHCLTVPLTLCTSVRVCNESHYAACQVPTVPDSCAC